MATLQELSERIMAQAEVKGFGTKPDDINTAEKIALLHSEVSEAYEAFRKKNLTGPHSFPEELADVLIRLVHLAGIHGVDLEEETLKKLGKNKDRDWDWEKMNKGYN